MTTREEHILAVAKQFGILNPRIEGFKSTEKGDNYMGELSFVKVIGSNKNLHLVYKAASNNTNMREKAFVREAFLNEIIYFTEIVPMMENMQTVDILGKCYAASAEPLGEYLIFENLNTSGYEMWNRKLPLNKEHMVGVFEMYAKYHAMSAGLKEKNADGFAAVTGKLQDVSKMFEESEAKEGSFGLMVEKIVNHFKGVLDEDLFARFAKFCQGMSIAMTKENLEHVAILHGDSWCNNVLFKYKDSDKTKPEAVKLIDFQMICLGPPVYDLATILYGCGTKDIFKNLDELLEIYQRTYAKQAKMLGMEKVYTLEELKKDWFKYGSMGLIGAFFYIKVMVSDSDEAPDLKESEGSFVGGFNYDSKHDDEYYSRIGDIIVHCGEIGIF